MCWTLSSMFRCLLYWTSSELGTVFQVQPCQFWVEEKDQLSWPIGDIQACHGPSGRQQSPLMNQPFSPQFHVGCELTEGARYPIFHTVNEDVEQDCILSWFVGYSAHCWFLTRHNTTLDLSVQWVFNPPHCLLIQPKLKSFSMIILWKTISKCLLKLRKTISTAHSSSIKLVISLQKLIMLGRHYFSLVNSCWLLRNLLVVT